MPNFYKNRLLLSGSTMTVLPTGTTASRENYPFPLTGAIRYNTDIGGLEFYNGVDWVSVTGTATVTYTIDNFVGDGTTTNFPLSSMPINASQIIVFVGSTYQAPFLPGGAESSYSIGGTGGDEIIFNEAPPLNAAINVILTGSS
jgi:hypothetical protein